MRLLKTVLATALVFFVAGCVNDNGVTRNATLEAPLPSVGEQALPSYTVRNVQIIVPETLSVSEANSIKPVADIVWRGDIGGTRHEQLRVLFEEAARDGAERLRGQVPVVAEMTLTRFHGLTQRTRYSYQGDYDINFVLVVRNANTGDVIEGPRNVRLVLDSPHPDDVLAMDARGYSERMFVKDYLVGALAQVLTH